MNKLEHDYFPMHFQQHSPEDAAKDIEPAIFSETHDLMFQQKMNSEKIEQVLAQWIKELRDWANDNAFLVGHIKVFVEGQENLWLSSTGSGINTKFSQGWSTWNADRVTLSLTAIIFGPLREALEETARAGLQACFKRLES